MELGYKSIEYATRKPSWKRFGVEPAILSAPLITTLVDATGLVIYFSIAKVILHL